MFSDRQGTSAFASKNVAADPADPRAANWAEAVDSGKRADNDTKRNLAAGPTAARWAETLDFEKKAENDHKRNLAADGGSG